jgi:HEAT repeat protein
VSAPALDLLSDDEPTRLAAIARVRETARASPEELSALVACLGHGRKVVQRAAADACAALAGAGVPMGDRLRAALAAESFRLRWGAAYALALPGPPPTECLPVLLETLAQADGDLRWAAAGLVVRMAGQPGVEAALRALLLGPSAAGRKMALYCLRDLGAASPEVRTAAAAALADPDTGVRLAALATVAALALDRADAATGLAVLLDDPDPGVRRAAAATLARFAPHPAAVHAALERAAASADVMLARAARRALGRGEE